MSRMTFMLIAGEPSGDLLAAELVTALKQSPDVRAMPFPPEFFGAGGPRMAEAGVKLAVDLTRHSVIGISWIKKYFELRRLFNQLFRLALERQPDVIIGVDYNLFNLRFARAVRDHIGRNGGQFSNWNPRIVKYVSPQVWASRPGRADRLAEDVDLLLSIFPFEKEWYAAHAPNVRVEFVGHPMADRFRKSEVGSRKPEVPAASPLILLLPGSRVAEVRRHLRVLLDSAEKIHHSRPEARFKMVWTNEELRRIADEASPFPSYLEMQTGGLDHALAGADLAIAKSGTVALECAFFAVPAVVFYKAPWPSYALARMVVRVNHLAMPNLLAGEEIYPEFVQHRATPENIAGAALELLNDAERRHAARKKLAKIVESLGPPGAAGRAARAIVNLLYDNSIDEPRRGLDTSQRVSV